MKFARGCRPLPLALTFIFIVPLGGTFAAVNCDTIPPRNSVSLTFADVVQINSSGGSDCWGWRAPDGTEYAIMGTLNGVSIVNAETGNLITTVSGPTVGCGGTRWRDMVTYGHYLYCVSECTGTNEGMMIIDMQYLPDSVHFVGTHTPAADRTSHNMAVDTATGYAYAVKRNYTGFRVMDLADPESPVELDWVQTFDLHDIYARNDTVWAAEANMGTFSMWNMADKENPALIARVGVPNAGYVHNIWPTDDTRFVVTTEETAFKTIKIWNIENPGAVQLVSNIIAPSQLAHNAQVWGDYVYMSHYESGVTIIDISTPECPVQVAQYDTWPSSENPNFNGCWGAYPYTRNGLVFGSNLNGQLYILQSDIVQVSFDGFPRIGEAPLPVQFNDRSGTIPTGWDWSFGDGDSSVAQNPQHTYDPGVFSVTLNTTTDLGTGSSSKQNYVIALAETLSSGPLELPKNTQAYWEVSYTNNVPIKEIVLPISLTNVPSVVFFDSISTVGTRTEYFEYYDIVFDNRFFGQMAVRLRADQGGGSPPLAPGSGPIARVWIRTRINAQAGQTSTMSAGQLDIHPFKAITFSTTFEPQFKGGTLTIIGSLTIGDINGDEVVNVIDVTGLIDYVFRSGTAPDPIEIGDTNCDGVINVIDVVGLINYVFRSGPEPCT